MWFTPAKGILESVRERLPEIQAYQQSPGKPGSVRGRDAAEVLLPRRGSGERLFDDLYDQALVRPGCQFRHHTAIFLVHQLGGNHVGFHNAVRNHCG